MLDVHILTMPDTSKAWTEQCLYSTFEAVHMAGFPVSVHVVPGVIGSIGQGRAHGYALGHYPYVTCIDDDDYVLPYAFRNMNEALEDGRWTAIATPENIERNGYMLAGKIRHHLIAYRRESIIDHRPWKCCGDVRQMHSIDESAWFDLNHVGYVHRVYESKARLMRRAHQDEMNQAISHG
jgi:hypothetical protein